MKRKSLLFSVWLLLIGIGITSPAWAHLLPQVAPYFGYCNVKSNTTQPNTNGNFVTGTLITAEVHDAAGPGYISHVTVEGPNGFNQILSPGAQNLFTFADPVNPPGAGEYKFTAYDTGSNSATSYYYLSYSGNVPVVDSNSMRAFYGYGSDPLSPLLTWSDPGLWGTNSVFEVAVYDKDNNLVWPSSTTPPSTTGVTNITVPSSVLGSNGPYSWSVIVLDNDQEAAADNRSESDKVQIPAQSDSGTGFMSARVYSLAGSPVSYVFEAQLAGAGVDLANGGSLVVNGPGVNGPDNKWSPGLEIWSFTTGDYSNGKYSHSMSTKPADGTYTFTVKDKNGQYQAQSSHWFQFATVPQVDVSTLQASEKNPLVPDPLAPMLTWTAPVQPNSNQPLYYSINIFDKSDGSKVWSTGGMGSTNWWAVQDAQGTKILQSGKSYQWQLQVQDSAGPCKPNNVARTVKVDLSVNNSKPNFLYGDSAFYQSQTGGMITYLAPYVDDPSSGAGLSSSMSLVVTGPNSFKYTFDPVKDLVPVPTMGPNTGTYQYFYKPSERLSKGNYTFTLKYGSPQKSLVTNSYLNDNNSIPLLDESTFLVTGDQAAPTVSWSAIPGYQGHLYYRLRIQDPNNVEVYVSPRGPYTAWKVPPGTLPALPAGLYQYRIEAAEDPSWLVFHERTVSQFFPLVPTTNAAPGAPTDVYAAPGNAEAAVSFKRPTSDGGNTITGYTVTSIPPDGTDANALTTAAIHHITGLINGTAYTFTVTATNDIETGLPSVASNSVTPSSNCLAWLAGTWNLSEIVAGSNAPQWGRGTLTINQDGTAGGTFTKSNNLVPENATGNIWSFPYGVYPELGNPDPDTLCQLDSSNTVFTCTSTHGDGSPGLMIGLKQADSYLAGDLAGNFFGDFTFTGLTESKWMTVAEAVVPAGTQNGKYVGAYSGTYKDSSGTHTLQSGNIALSPTGQITCLSGACLTSANYQSFLGASKTISVGTAGAETTGEDAQFSIFIKKASSYSQADLTGVWVINELDAWSDGPSGGNSGTWTRGVVTIDSNGNATMSGVSNNGAPQSGSGTLSIDPASGLVSCAAGDCKGKPMWTLDKSKTIAIEVSGQSPSGGNTWSESDIQILTKKPPQTGFLKVTIAPANAVLAGAMWSADGGNTWNDSGTLVTLPVGGHTVTFNSITGWNSPLPQTVPVSNGNTATAQATYTLQSGSISVTITPAGLAGAQWQLDSNPKLHNSGEMVPSLAVGSHTITFTDVTGWTTPTPKTVLVSNNKVATASGVYVEQFGSLKAAISPQGAVTAGAKWQVDGAGAWHNSGDTALNIPVGPHEINFKPITGWDAPAQQPVTVLNGQTATPPSGVYVRQTGSLNVTISPADLAGAQWSVDGGKNWNPGGTPVSLPVGTYKVTFNTITGWDAPSSLLNVAVSKNQTTQETVAYTQQVGSLKVTINPASLPGTQWQIDGAGAWYNSGVTAQNVAVGSHTVNFNVISGWFAPDSQPVTIKKKALTTITATYKIVKAQWNLTLTTGSRTVGYTDKSAAATGSIATRQWNFGDGTTSTQLSGTHTFLKNGSYKVTLTVQGTTGDKDSIWAIYNFN